MNRRKTIFSSTAILIVLVFSGMITAQNNRTDKSGEQAVYHRMYDTTTIDTITGKVTVVTDTLGRNDTTLTVLRVTGTSDTTNVHLGPKWFIDKQALKIETGDTITVIGSRVTYFGTQIIIAGTIKSNGTTYNLRDKKGLPVWKSQATQKPRGTGKKPQNKR